MFRRTILTTIAITCTGFLFAQNAKKPAARVYPDSIAPVGIIRGLSDSALLDVVQRQTFRYFWHFAHPVSGLARERDNTVKAEYYWDYINEAYDEPNLSKGTFGPEACAIGGTGFGILSTIVAVNRGWIGRDTALKPAHKNCRLFNKSGLLPWHLSSFYKRRDRQNHSIRQD